MRKFNYRGRLILASTKQQAIRKVIAYSDDIQAEALKILERVTFADITGADCWHMHSPGNKMHNVGPEYRRSGPGAPYQQKGVGYRKFGYAEVADLEADGVDMSALRNASADIADDTSVSVTMHVGFDGETILVIVSAGCDDFGVKLLEKEYTLDSAGLARLEGDINTLDAGPSLGLA